MTDKTYLDRPALTAIAAALVLASTPAWAQDTAPTETAPIAEAPAPQLETATPALPPIVMPSPQAAPQAAAVAPKLPEVSNEVSQGTSRVAERVAPVERVTRPTPASAAPTRTSSPTVASPVPSNPAARPTVTPAITPAATVVDQSSGVQAAPAPQTAFSQPDNSAYWVVGAGGVALILGVGALAFLRRRDRQIDEREDVSVMGFGNVAVREPTPLGAPTIANANGFAPIITVNAEGTGSVTAHSARTQPESTPNDVPVAAYAAARAPAQMGNERFGELEAMIAQAPNAENPFLTRRKRLRRAEFICNQRGEAPVTVDSEPVRAEQLNAAIAAKQSQEHQKQSVFSYGKKPVSFRPNGWKPATN